MDTSMDSLSDTESNSSWILVNDGMCGDDNRDITKSILNQEEQRVEGSNEKESGHESDTSDGISIISGFDSDHERNIQNAQNDVPGDKDCAEDEEALHDEGGNFIDTAESRIAEEKHSKHSKIPHLVTISIFGAVFAVSSVFILQLLNAHEVQDLGGSEFSQSRKEVALPKHAARRIEKGNFDIVEYCAVKHKSDEMFQKYNERKCVKTHAKPPKINTPNGNRGKRTRKVKNSELKINFTDDDSDVASFASQKLKPSKSKSKQHKKENGKGHKNEHKSAENDIEKIDGNTRLQRNKKQFLTQRFAQEKEQFLVAKENYLRNKERYLRNMAVTIKEKWRLGKEKKSASSNGTRTRTRTRTETDSPRKEQGRKTKRYGKQKNRMPETTTTVVNNENFNKYKNLSPKLYKSRRNNSITGDWYHNLYKERGQMRKSERLSEWLFDRAEMRNRKRDKAQWYFQWMADREQFRYKRGYRFASN